MFSHAALATLNALEMQVYHFVITHRDTICSMTIRQLAEAAGVSTTTVLRFCRKMECDGWAEFRIRVKLWLAEPAEQPENFGLSDIMGFFRSIDNAEFDAQIARATRLLAEARQVIFVGAGSSGTLGKYGARFFSNMGKLSSYIDDPWYPINRDGYRDAVAVILSVSGETAEILRLASQLSQQHCRVISLTRSAHCSLAGLSDLNLSYHIPQDRLAGQYDITSQIPVMYLLETLGRSLALRG
ncbi:MurR/RpiR family transcriptional regulator [Pantoea sp. 1.19]|uniref:MurR/RpiR family transcriptional regulator n=1 Tax=Pantoea sp. 1.19 TaxID=1925589 RepID=UPI000948C670|nr:MurR/RpiR family transcriptional regulator [Pantoea sp. 1.19]